MGIVVESVEASNTECTCKVIDGERICWSEGIVGMLSDEQEQDYCTVFNKTPVSSEYRSHIKKFKEFAEISDRCLEKEADTWECVEEEAEKRQ